MFNASIMVLIRKQRWLGALRKGCLNIVAGISSATAALAVVAISSRAFGLEALGDISVILSVNGVLAIIEGSATMAWTRGVANGTMRVGARFLGGRAWVSVVIAGGAGCGAAWWLLGSPYSVLGAGVTAGSVFQIVTAHVNGKAQGDGRYGIVAIGSLLQSLVLLVACGLVFVWASPALIGLGYLGGTVVGRLYLWQMVKESGNGREDHGREVSVLRSTTSLVLLSATAPLATLNDLMAVRILLSAVQAGLYRAGSQLPSRGSALVWRGVDTVYPRLAAESLGGACALARRWSRITSLVTAGALAALAAARGPMTAALLGRESHTAGIVLLLFSAVWVVNSAAHILSLLVIAQGIHHKLIGIVYFELLANCALTVPLVIVWGAAGSVLATLVTLGISNLVLLPAVYYRALPINAFSLVWRDGICWAALGAGGAYLVASALLKWL